MAIVHSYVRFSTPEQAMGDSERRQFEAAKDWCKSNKHSLSDIRFFDSGKSSFRGDKQKALAAFLKAVEEGRVKSGDILLVEAVDRLSRKGIRDTQNLVNGLLNRGIDIAILTPIQKVYRANDKNDIGGAIELAAFAYAAHIYSDMLSTRIKSSWVGARKKIENGEKIGGHTVSWLTLDKDSHKFVVDQEKAAVIKYIFKRTLDGLGAPSICKELNDKFTPFGKKTWNEVYIRNQILMSRTVLGERQNHKLNEKGKRTPIGEPVVDYYPRIIDEKTWLAAQKAIANRRIERGPSGDFVNLFTGLMWHAVDDCPLHIYTYQQKRADGRKVIQRRFKSYKAIENVKGASTETIDIAMFEKVIFSDLKEIDVSSFGSGSSNSVELGAVQAQLDKRQKRLKEIQSELRDSDKPVAILVRLATDLETEIAELKAKARSLAAKNGENPRANLEHLLKLAKTNSDRQMLREAIKKVIEKIHILTFKIGTQKKSPVCYMVQVDFVAGHKRFFGVALGNILNLGVTESSLSSFTEKTKNGIRKAFEKIVKDTKNSGHIIRIEDRTSFHPEIGAIKHR